MHIGKVKNQSWSGIPFDRTLYHCRRDQVMFGWHWRHVTFAILHAELLQAIFEIFFLRYEDAIALLMNLKT